MANSSILGGQRAPQRPQGHDVDSLGPSDSSDSGSDIQGERSMPTVADNRGELGALPVNPVGDSDARGTGERGSATGRDVTPGTDILPDRIGHANEPNASIEAVPPDGLPIDATTNVEDLAVGNDSDDSDDSEDGDQGPDTELLDDDAGDAAAGRR